MSEILLTVIVLGGLWLAFEVGFKAGRRHEATYWAKLICDANERPAEPSNPIALSCARRAAFENAHEPSRN